MMLAAAGCLAENGPFSLPIDFSPGMPLSEDCYINENEYKDPSIHVTIEHNRKGWCDYWVARIKIQDPSQLRTAAAAGFDEVFAMNAEMLAKRQNAVLAIDGDYFCYSDFGFVLRQGELFMDELQGERDVLAIDEDGNFHTFYLPDSGEVPTEIDGKKVINAFHFGPALVVNGQIGQLKAGEWMVPTLKRQRMCIAQTGPLEYMALCCAAPARGSSGMDIREFAKLAKDLGAITAYNLDGGDSTIMIFRNKKINDVNNKNTRDISDILYFASAWDPAKTEAQ